MYVLIVVGGDPAIVAYGPDPKRLPCVRCGSSNWLTPDSAGEVMCCKSCYAGDICSMAAIGLLDEACTLDTGKRPNVTQMCERMLRSEPGLLKVVQEPEPPSPVATRDSWLVQLGGLGGCERSILTHASMPTELLVAADVGTMV